MPSEIDMTMDEARALTGDGALWPLVRGFLWDFAPQVHESWLEGVPGMSGNPGMSGLAGNPRVKSFILSSLDIAPCFHTFPKGDWSRLLLLDGQTLESVVKWLGALAMAEDLRRVTAGATVRELKSSLPGIYPEVFGFTAYFKGLAGSRGDAEAQGLANPAGDGRPSVAGEVVSAGVSILVSVLAPLPGALISRLKFKLPKAFCASAPLRETENPPANAQAALAKLLKLKFPEAYTICC